MNLPRGTKLMKKKPVHKAKKASASEIYAALGIITIPTPFIATCVDYHDFDRIRDWAKKQFKVKLDYYELGNADGYQAVFYTKDNKPDLDSLNPKETDKCDYLSDGWIRKFRKARKASGIPVLDFTELIGQ